MKNKIFIFCILIFTFILGLGLKPSFSNDKVYAKSSVDNFYFPYYEVTLDVRDDNSFLITEKVTVHYNQAYKIAGYTIGKHKGWVRAIPTWANVSRNVGDDKKPTETYYEYKISGLKCTQGKLYNRYSDENFYYIEFGGDSYVNIESDFEEEYVFSYEYKIGYDFLSEIDELYFNLHGSDHSTKVEEFKFTINMPHEFDESKIMFYVGEYGESEIPANIRYEVEGNTISNQVAFDAKLNGEENHGVIGFEPYEGLTIRCELPKGYFTSVNANVYEDAWINIIGIVLTILCIIFVIILVIMKSGRNKPVVTVEFYPPDGITPADASYIASAKISAKQMTSLILYWASAGCVKINLDETNNPVSITKIKQLPSTAKGYEKEIFDQMFLQSSTYILSKYDYELARKFNQGANDVKNILGDRYTTKSKLNVFLIGVVAWLPILWLTILTYIIRAGDDFMAQLIMANLYILIMFWLTWMVRRNVINSYKLKNKNWFRILNVLILTLYYLLSFVSYSSQLDPWGLRYYAFVPFIVFMLLAVDVFGIGNTVLQINDSLRENYGKLIGFKNNIIKVEYEKMQMLLKEDPEYFYHILPYAYAFDITDEFVKNFEGLTILPNDSYSGMAILHMHMMTRSLTHSVARTIIPSSSSGRSGGGFSGGGGGGFSGGGSGGGGSFGR